MDPKEFLLLAKDIEGNSAKSEAQTRTAIDRCYYSVAHVYYNKLEKYISQSQTQDKEDVMYLRRKIHMVLRRLLKETDRTLSNRLGKIWKHRKWSTYELDRPKTDFDLQDDVEVAEFLITNTSRFLDSLSQAYEQEKVDSDFWLDLALKEFERPRNKRTRKRW